MSDTQTRILAQYTSELGYDEVGDRGVDLDVVESVTVPSVDAGAKLIGEKQVDGCGLITEQMKTRYGWWDVTEHYVDHGQVYYSELVEYKS